MNALAPYRQVWLLDFEFHAPTGERPTPICMVAREWHSGRTIRLWERELCSPPFSVSPDVLFIAFYASAEWGCFLALDWPMPSRILDLFVEFRCLTNGLAVPCGSGLLGALAFCGLDAMGAAEKDDMRDLAIRGGPFSEIERAALLSYCESDINSLGQLLPKMLPLVDLPRALLRGRYTVAAAQMEWHGTPVDVETLEDLRDNWDRIKSRLVQDVDETYGVYVPAGQRAIDPATPFGAAILETATEFGIDPHVLQSAAAHLWKAERESAAEHEAAITEARKRTGLTPNRINRIEDSGRDHSSIPRLDETARGLAGELPQLGIGGAFDGDADRDSAGELWELLREPQRRAPRRDDPEILRRAAELVASTPDAEYSGAFSFSEKNASSPEFVGEFWLG